MLIYNSIMHSRINVGGQSTFTYYKIVLFVLVFLAIGLIIAVVTMANSNSINDNNDIIEPTSNYVLPDRLQGDDLTPEDEIAKQVAIMSHTKGTSSNDIEEYYDSVIDKAFEDGDRLLAMDIIIQKATYLSSINEDCEGAIKYTDGLDFSIFSDEEKQFLASHLQSELSECDDELEEE